MTNDKWEYLLRMSKKHGCLLRCGGKLYEVSSHQYPTGLKFVIDEVTPVDIPEFTPEEA